MSVEIMLLGDDQYVAIQMRGGPEPLMVTGWMQIMSLDPSYIGTYHCIATNTIGQVYEMATVGVYRNDEFWWPLEHVSFWRKNVFWLLDNLVIEILTKIWVLGVEWDLCKIWTCFNCECRMFKVVDLK